MPNIPRFYPVDFLYKIKKSKVFDINQSALKCIILFYKLAITIVFFSFLHNHVLIKESISGIIYMALESSLKK